MLRGVIPRGAINGLALLLWLPLFAGLFVVVEASASPSVIRGPYLQQGSETSLVIRWRTDVETESNIWYGETAGLLDNQAGIAGLTTEHEVQLSGLNPETHYFYGVGTADSLLVGDDPGHTFSTSPLGGLAHRTRLWVIGDSGRFGPDQSNVRDAYLSYTMWDPADLMIVLGDLGYDIGSDEQYQTSFFQPYAEILRNTMIWTTQGNHDQLHEGPDNDYYDFFTLPSGGEAGGVPSGSEAYYSFDHANIHFVCLDSETTDRTPTGPMLTWLQADLAATDQEWIISFWHRPPYSKGSHDSDIEIEMIEMRENALPILEAKGVDLVLNGHSHSYERSLLLDEHYGASDTLADSMVVDGGDGDPSGSGTYRKATLGAAPHEGTIYAVPGSASRLNWGPLDHPVMIRSINDFGSMVIDIEGNHLEAIFLDDQGGIQDRFNIFKGLGITQVGSELYTRVSPTLSVRPNPVRGRAEVIYESEQAGWTRVEILRPDGRRMAILEDRFLPSGVHSRVWDPDLLGVEAMPSGVYFFRLTTDRGTSSAKIHLIR